MVGTWMATASFPLGTFTGAGTAAVPAAGAAAAVDAAAGADAVTLLPSSSRTIRKVRAAPKTKTAAPMAMRAVERLRALRHPCEELVIGSAKGIFGNPNRDLHEPRGPFPVP